MTLLLSYEIKYRAPRWLFGGFDIRTDKGFKRVVVPEDAKVQVFDDKGVKLWAQVEVPFPDRIIP